MNKTKLGLAVVGIAIGVLTLRSLRGRRSETPDEDQTTEEQDEEPDTAAGAFADDIEASDTTAREIEEAAEEGGRAKAEAIVAAKHAAGAVKHATLAAREGVRSRREAGATETPTTN